jgi:hypothetical protein
MDQDSNSAGRPSPRVLISSVKVILPRVTTSKLWDKKKLKGRKNGKKRKQKKQPDSESRMLTMEGKES